VIVDAQGEWPPWTRSSICCQGLGAIAVSGHDLLALVVAASLGAALGIVRPARREIVPRSFHVVQAQILLAIVEWEIKKHKTPRP